MKNRQRPVTLAQLIIVANGHDLMTNTDHLDVYESRVLQEIVSGKFTAIVREYGSIDTTEELLLVNTTDRVCARVTYHCASSPSCHWGHISIQELKETGEGVVVKYTVGTNNTPHEKKYSLRAQVETVSKTIARLDELD